MGLLLIALAWILGAPASQGTPTDGGAAAVRSGMILLSSGTGIHLSGGTDHWMPVVNGNGGQSYQGRPGQLAAVLECTESAVRRAVTGLAHMLWRSRPALQRCALLFPFHQFW